jgi:DNA-binding GntR family transcriptional regulator
VLLRLYPQRGALVVPDSSEEARAVIEARLVLERFAASAVIGRGPATCAAVFERLSGELQRQSNAVAEHDWPAFLAADCAFHEVTLEQSGNRILSDFYSSLRHRQMAGESVIRDTQRMTTIMDEHRRGAARRRCPTGPPSRAEPPGKHSAGARSRRRASDVGCRRFRLTPLPASRLCTCAPLP